MERARSDDKAGQERRVLARYVRVSAAVAGCGLAG